ncbi:MAG: PQQ-binding-like beta-propeller repeat protein [Pirellulaceae bacterium]
MSMRFKSLAVLCLAGWISLQGFVVSADDGNIVSDVKARAAGLTVQWFTQLSNSHGEIVSSEVVVDENDSTTYFELSGGGLKQIISDRDISPAGQVFGVEGAESFAKLRQEIMQAELDFHEIGEKIEIERYSIPKITVFAMTSNGIVHCIDGESGEMRWKTEIGKRSFPSVGMGANKNYVAAVNGSRVYCMEADTGKVIFEHQCREAVLSAPAVGDEYVFVPLANGALQALPIKSKAFGNSPLNAVGSATTPPIVAGNIVAWTTDAGYIVVSDRKNMKSMKYRIRGAGEFAASPAASNDRLFAATLNGFVYAIDDLNGAVMWNFSLGERVTNAPVPFGDYLFIVTDEHHLYKFDGKTGDVAAGWEIPIEGITGIVGASAERLYLKDLVGNIVVVDRVSGQRMGQVDSGSNFASMVNDKTDRIYICTKSGLVQCMREVDRERPMFHADFVEVVAAEQPETIKKADEPEASDNPFGGKKAEPKSDSSNPFKTNNDNSDGGNPFKTGGGNDDGNPFKGG